MLASYAASRHRQIVPCCMISSVSHDNVSRLVTDRSMCFATALDKAFENINCISAILRCQPKNLFYESTQRLIQPRRVLWDQGQRAQMTFRSELQTVPGDDDRHPIELRRGSEISRSAGEETDALLHAFESQPLDRLL